MQRIVCSDILGETVVRLGGAVHPVHFATKSCCWYWRANLDSVYGLFHRIELFLVRDQTVRYNLPANPGNIAVKNQYLLVDDIDSRLLGGFADENRA